MKPKKDKDGFKRKQGDFVVKADSDTEAIYTHLHWANTNGKNVRIIVLDESKRLQTISRLLHPSQKIKSVKFLKALRLRSKDSRQLCLNGSSKKKRLLKSDSRFKCLSH
jgi:hypothetical protein